MDNHLFQLNKHVIFYHFLLFLKFDYKIMVVFLCVINKKAIIVTKPGIPKSPTKIIENIFMGIIKFKGNAIRL